MAAVVLGLVGMAVGSFLNVCIDRLPRGQSIVVPPSHCEVCQHRLAAADLIPVLSYLWLRGCCRYCGAAIPVRLPLVELATGWLFTLLWLRYGWSSQWAIITLYSCLAVIILAIDVEHHLIPNRIVYPAMVIAVILSPLWPELGIVNSLLGGAVSFLLLLVPFRIYPEGLGGGDVKLAGLVGLMTGFPLSLVALLVAVVGGGLVAALALFSGRRGRRDPIPFGPFLVASALVTLLWGRTIWEWYSQRFF